MKKRGLGKGLSELGVDALLNSALAVEQEQEPVDAKSTTLTVLPISTLTPGRYQPRRHMDPTALEELANSIRAQGVIQPIVVRKNQDHYEIVAGERRFRAAQMADLKEVPVVIKDINDEAAMAMSLIENIQRQDLNVIEEAQALQRLLQEFAMTHQEVAGAVGKSRASVTNILRLLKLNDDVRALVEQGHLDMGHARALLALEGEKQSEMANTIVARALSVREAEKLICQQQNQAAPREKAAPLVDVDIDRLQKNLSERLGVSVSIKQNNKGRGKLVIAYKNTDQLDEILQHFE